MGVLVLGRVSGAGNWVVISCTGDLLGFYLCLPKGHGVWMIPVDDSTNKPIIVTVVTTTNPSYWEITHHQEGSNPIGYFINNFNVF
jgi:hypothetical protein